MSIEAMQRQYKAEDKRRMRDPLRLASFWLAVLSAFQSVAVVYIGFTTSVQAGIIACSVAFLTILTVIVFYIEHVLPRSKARQIREKWLEKRRKM